MNSITKSNYQVGMPYALDRNGLKVDARDAEEHTAYECPFCHCRMFRKRSPKDNYFFSRFPGEIHSAKQCEQIEKSGKYHSFAVSESPQSLIDSLCRLSSRRQAAGQINHKRNDITVPSPNEDLLAVKYTSLKQIYEMGIADKLPNERVGNYVVSDYYIHYNWIQDVFGLHKIDLKARILHTGVITCNPNSKLFLFRMYTPGNSYSIRFGLRCTTSSVFAEIHQKLFEKRRIDTSNKLQTIKKCTQALIAGNDWIYINQSQCKGFLCAAPDKYCNNCHGLYIATATTPKQVYPIPLLTN